MSTFAFDPATQQAAQNPLTPAGQQTMLPGAMWLQRNPQLPQTPMGAYTDSVYAAQDAQLRHDISQQYADILQQLGYVDPNTGQFIQGSVEAQANRQQADLQRQMQLADEQVTQQHQQLGTLFSGLRGTDQARAEFPMVSGISDLMTQTPLTLQQLYEKAAGLTDVYTLQQNQNIAAAADRAAGRITAAPPGDTTTTTPPPDTTPPPSGITPGAYGTTGGTTGPYIGTTPEQVAKLPTVFNAQPKGPGTNAFSASTGYQGGHYDPMRGIWVK